MLEPSRVPRERDSSTAKSVHPLSGFGCLSNVSVLWVLRWPLQSLLGCFYSTFQVKKGPKLQKGEKSLVFFLIKPSVGTLSQCWHVQVTKCCIWAAKRSPVAREQLHPRSWWKTGTPNTASPASTGQAPKSNKSGSSCRPTAAFIPVEEHLAGETRGQSPPLWPCQLLLMCGCVGDLSLNTPLFFSVASCLPHHFSDLPWFPQIPMFCFMLPAALINIITRKQMNSVSHDPT